MAVLRGGRAQGHRGGAGRRPRGRQDLDPRVDRPPAPAGGRLRGRPGPDRAHRVHRPSPTTATTCGSGWRRSAPTRWPKANAHHRQGRAQRRPRRGHRHHRGDARRRVPRPRAARSRRRCEALTKKLVRKRIVEEGVRIDGRGTSDIRPLSAEVDLFPTAHGSALFQRGETQVLNVTTLGMPRMNQLLDTISPDESKRYMHHYNFPPFSTGETGFMRGPEAPGDRARPAGRAGPAAGRPLRGGLPLHPPPGLRRAGLQRLDLDGLGVRVDPVADGGRACRSRRRWPASPWAWSTTRAPTSP